MNRENKKEKQNYIGTQ